MSKEQHGPWRTAKPYIAAITFLIIIGGVVTALATVSACSVTSMLVLNGA